MTMDQRIGAKRFRSRQWLATLAATLVMVYVGSENFWMLKTLNDLFQSNAASKELLRAGYFVAVTSAVIGAVLGAVLADKFGRKKTLLVTSIFAVGQILSTLTSNAVLSCVALFIGEIGLGIMRVAVPLFVSEIVDDDNRGTLLMVQLPLFYCGRLLVVWIESLNSIEIFGTVSEVVTGIFIASFLCFPETPYYLVLKKKYEAASKSLAFYRGVESAEANDEIDLIIKNIEPDKISQGFLGKSRELVQSNNRKSLLIIVFFIIAAWSDQKPHSPNDLEDVLIHTIILDNYYAKIITCIISLIASVIIVFTIDVFGRRSLLLYSTFGGFTIAIISIIVRITRAAQLTWIRHVIKIISHFYLLIIFSVPLVYVGELFTTNVKALAIAIVTVVDLSKSFIIVALYESFDLNVNKFIFTTCLLLAFPIVLAFAPETMRKSFPDIQIELSTFSRFRIFRKKI